MGKVSVFSDDVEEIAHEVKQFFDEDLVLNDELVELKYEINSSHLKMARVPSSVKLAFGKDPSKVSAQPHTIVTQICFPNGNVLFLSLFSLFKN